VDSIIVFRQLNQADIREIVDIILGEVNERLIEYEFSLELTDAARDWLVEHGYDRDFGARPLRRLIQSTVEDKLSDAVLSGRFSPGDVILIDAANDEIVLAKAENGSSNHNEDTDEVEEEVLPTT
jgi:ATP-dependent Clp protease ATP-binding subunit ClpC